jgi:LAO/AO transport system kinase
MNLNQLQSSDYRYLARAITLVENDYSAGKELLMQLNFKNKVPVIGVTGPPGAGKSSLVNELIKHLLKDNKKIGILAIDPTSPFNYGSLLGDRIRMSEHFNHPNVYIRSLATRGSLGGLSAKIYEITDVMKHAGFDAIFIETVGVGQSEVEIAGLADTTAVVLVPEAGDEVQTLKSGLMEIADVFVVNKSDRDGADGFVKNLSALVHSKSNAEWEIPVVKTIATSGMGIGDFWQSLTMHNAINRNKERQMHLTVEKAFNIILSYKMRTINKELLYKQLEEQIKDAHFNLYQFINNNYSDQ